MQNAKTGLAVLLLLNSGAVDTGTLYSENLFEHILFPLCVLLAFRIGWNTGQKSTNGILKYE